MYDRHRADGREWLAVTIPERGEVRKGPVHQSRKRSNDAFVSAPGPAGSPTEASRRDVLSPPADDLGGLSRSFRVAQQVVTSDRVGDELGRPAIAEIGEVDLVAEAFVAHAGEQLGAIDGVGSRGELQAREGPPGRGIELAD